MGHAATLRGAGAGGSVGSGSGSIGTGDGSIGSVGAGREGCEARRRAADGAACWAAYVGWAGAHGLITSRAP